MQKLLLRAFLYFLVQPGLSTPAFSQSNFNFCAPYHCNGIGIPGVHFDLTLTGVSPALPPFTLLGVSDTTGCVSLGNGIPITDSVTATLHIYRDTDPLEGVNMLDVILISRHILGVEPLSSPYKMIAADANKSGSITTSDIVQLRNLILGIYAGFPNNTSWRFVDTSFVFPNPANPFQTQPVDTVGIVPGVTRIYYGIKVGDVNCTALLSFTSSGEESLTMPDLSLQANDIVEVPIYFLAAHQSYGFQFGLRFDSTQIELLDIIPVTSVNSALFADHVNVVWSGTSLNPSTFSPGQPIYRLRIKALTALHLSDAISMDTATLLPQSYPTLSSLVNLNLKFATVATAEPGAIQTILDPLPNPTTAGVRVPLRLEQSATVMVELLDATGRRIYQYQQDKNPGAQWLDIPATAFPRAGVYFWRVQVGVVSRMGKIVRQ